MLEKLLANIKIFDFQYNDQHFTFDITWGNQNSTVPQTRSLLTNKQFPTHTPFQFLDEQVQIHDKLMFWLKDEKTLLAEGWQKRGKSSLVHKNVKFKLGEEKRQLLGTVQQGKIGITREFEPFIFIENGWRFSPAEVQMVLKMGLVEKPRATKIQTASGIFTFDPVNEAVVLPSGHTFSGQMLKDLRTLMRFAKLI